MPEASLDEEMAIGPGMLYKHARQYVKTALGNSPLKDGDDFAFLATLQETGDLSSKEKAGLYTWPANCCISTSLSVKMTREVSWVR